MEEQKLHRTAALLSGPKAGGYHAGVIDHDYVPGLQETGKIAKARMRHRPSAGNHQEAARIPWLHWLLGDEFPGDGEIEILELHLRLPAAKHEVEQDGEDHAQEHAEA